MDQNVALALAGSLIAGILIGSEREFRARPAGLRTHSLVALASTLLMLASTHQGEWTAGFLPGTNLVADPTRMAHGVLTGIGFLCAGVIFREGFSVQGLTTAGSLWMTTALGLLFGAGLHLLAITGTAVTLIVLVLFRVVDRLMPRQLRAELRVRVTADSAGSDRLEALLDEYGLKAGPWTLRGEDGGIERSARISGRAHLDMATFAVRLGGLPGVTEFELIPLTD